MASAGRSFTLPPGLRYSSLASRWQERSRPDPVEPHEGRVADEVDGAVDDLHRRSGIGDRLHCDAGGREDGAIAEQHGREAGVVHVAGDLDGQRRIADDADQARDDPPQLPDQRRCRRPGGHRHDPSSSRRQAMRRLVRLDHEEHVDAGHTSAPGSRESSFHGPGHHASATATASWWSSWSTSSWSCSRSWCWSSRSWWCAARSSWCAARSSWSSSPSWSCAAPSWW